MRVVRSEGIDMGLGDMADKAKDAVGNEENSDKGLDKGANVAKDKLGHDDQVDKARDFADGKVGDEK